MQKKGLLELRREKGKTDLRGQGEGLERLQRAPERENALDPPS